MRKTYQDNGSLSLQNSIYSIRCEMSIQCGGSFFLGDTPMQTKNPLRSLDGFMTIVCLHRSGVIIVNLRLLSTGGVSGQVNNSSDDKVFRKKFFNGFEIPRCELCRFSNVKMEYTSPGKLLGTVHVQFIIEGLCALELSENRKEKSLVHEGTFICLLVDVNQKQCEEAV